MRNQNYFALMSAALLTGAVAFSSCSSDDELAGDNTGTTPTGEVVKTQFAINIPYSAPGTRMTNENTQNNSNFLGMKNVRLVSFDGDPASTQTFLSIIPLTDISGISSTASSKIYNDVNVPVGTDNFLFYATAPMTDKFANGSIKATLDGVSTRDAIRFELETAKGTDTDNEGQALLSVLNGIAQVPNWSDGAGVDEELKALYTTFITLTAGSATSIEAALENLYNTVDRWANESGDPASASKNVALAIRTAITNGGTFTVSGASAPYDVTTTLTYPKNINMPDGAVKLTYNSGSKTFSYVDAGNLTGLSTFDIDKVCYPASLYYFINTDIATSNSTEVTWPTTTNDWTNSAPWASGWGNTVNATTRAIALKKNIQYAVANMKLTVKCATGALTDNGTDVNPAVYVTVPLAGFPVTGVLVGGQPTAVDWQFAPTASNAFDYTVYDKVTGVAAQNNVASGTNYTLLLPNTATTATPVNFAIELENNSGVEFRGQDGVVPVGGKFYLVGQLNPAGKDVSGVVNPQVFMSDYTTTVNATIKTLENAYNTIPDLRATKMELGLSVDLTWKAGMRFDVNIGE